MVAKIRVMLVWNAENRLEVGTQEFSGVIHVLHLDPVLVVCV